MKKLLLSLMLFAFLLTGCATLQGFIAATENPIFQRTVQYAVIRYLAAEPEKQPEALRIVNELQRHVEGSAQITVFELEDIAIEKIPWDKLNPADQFLIMGMIADISALLREQVGDGVLDEDSRVKARAFLRWIEQAVVFAR